MKFGGTSVRNADMIRKVVQIAEDSLAEGPVLVASAMGDTTDALVELAELAQAGDEESASEIVDNLEAAHTHAAGELECDDDVLADVIALFEELRSLVHGIALIRECSPRSRDALLSFGERLSTRIIAGAATRSDFDVVLVDARTIIRTDARFGSASPDMRETTDLVHDALKPRSSLLYVTQGFIASTADGVTTTLGRGGSDFTATIIGAALDAEKVEIWTDVDGIMSADPRLVPGARKFSDISYDEAAELAYFGAKVVHPFTILPAVKRQIPVYVRNTSHPSEPGTRIAAGGPGEGVRAIASKRGITLVTVKSSRMLNAYGFLRAIFAVFAEHGVPVDLVATSEVSVSVTVDSGTALTEIIDELDRLGRVSVQTNKAIVAIVGGTMFDDPRTVSQVFAAVAPAPVRLISFGSSAINLSLVIDETDESDVLTRLHSRLWQS